MDYNIFKDSRITCIFLTYQLNGARKKYSVRLRFMDQKECYFATPFTQDFVKPKKKTPIDITAYTPDGVYTTKVTLLDSNLSINDVLFNVTIPKTWDFKQLRESTRKCINLNFNIKFNDGFEINGETYDLSVGGFSYLSKEKFSSIYERINTIVTINMPDMIIDFPDKKLVCEGKFVRKKDNFKVNGMEGTLYAFKFVSMPKEEKELLKHYLLCLE